MTRPLYFILILALSLTIGAKASTISVVDSKCENLVDPLGIATTSPRLSWKIKSSKNGTSQRAFQILVASDPKLLNEKKADLWNSGKQQSSASILVPYSGKSLQSGSVCYWKVKIWDENDKATDWSAPASFTVGLLDKSDWKAEYIGFPSTNSAKLSPQLRKSFTLSDTKGRFFLHVNSLGYHEVYLNGKKVGDKVLAPAVSQFNKRSLSVTYDLSPYLKKGNNDLVLWIGKGWYNMGFPGVVAEGPFVKAQMKQVQDEKREIIIVTDASWTGRDSGYSDTGTWRAHNFEGERVDGSLLLPELSAKSLDKVSWIPVSVLKDPGYEVTPQQVEGNAIVKTIKPEKVSSVGENVWLVDMGTTLTGWIEIHFPQLNKGQMVKMEYTDHLDKGDKFVKQGQEDSYVASGGKNEVFRNRFNYHGFRYVRISNLSQAPKKDNITASLIHTDYKLASTFECSDPDINRLHDMIFYTLRCLSLGGDLVDCPHIERLGYGGDGNASTATAQFMFDLSPLYANWLQAWADCIREDGGMPHTAPNPYSAGGGPYWCGFLITASWHTYQNYGDSRILEKYYPEMQQWLGYVEKYSPSGLLKPWANTEYRNWYLGDWAVPDGVDQSNQASVTLVNNCFVAVCYEKMEKIAAVLGKTEDVKKYLDKKTALQKLINQKLFDSTSNIYGSGSQIDQTYPLLAGVVPDSQVEPVKQNLYEIINKKHSGHFATGLVGIPVFTEWAVKSKETSLMYSMLKKRDYPSYLYMIDNGATTTWEHWNGRRSRIHNCYNGIGTWFYQSVAGIRADETVPAYQRLVIDPQIPEGITWAKASKETTYGTVLVSWKVDKGEFAMKVVIPAGSTAGVVIPDTIKSYKLDGKTCKNEGNLPDLGSGGHEVSWVCP